MPDTMLEPERQLSPALGSHTQKRSPGVRQISNYRKMSSA